MSIYKEFSEYTPVSRLSGLQWFTLEKKLTLEKRSNMICEYVFKSQPKLLNIGRGEIREWIIQRVLAKEPLSPISEYSDPDYQYSGDRENNQYHAILQKHFSNSFDGTFIHPNHLESSDSYSIIDLDGASEIVLWKNHKTLLKEI